MSVQRFNVRVYFLLFNEERTHLLVSDEWIAGGAYTKFPGGGLEWGEGLLDAACREAREELGQEVRIVRHVYTTDFFIASAFRPTDQVISVYYEAELLGAPQFRTSVVKHDFLQRERNEESFRWVHVDAIRVDEFSFPADRAVVEHLLDQASSLRAT